jgi:predicted membrane-bound mannosyltransferase
MQSYAMLKRAIAATEVVLILPAAVFMAAILVRNVTPLPKEPAATAQRVVLWYAHLPPQVGLWGLLSLLPLAVLVVGCGAILSSWETDATLRAAAQDVGRALRAHAAIVLTAATTVMAAGILAFVAVHMMTD